MIEVEKIKKLVDSLYVACQYGDLSRIESIIEGVDVEEHFSDGYEQYMGGELNVGVLENIIHILSFIENETPIPSPVSDTTYDKILEVLNNHGISSIGTNGHLNDDDGNVKEHRYPELRGSLQKVHFPTKKEVPQKDSRKSLEEWLTPISPMINSLDQKDRGSIYVDYKWDGASNVFECSGTTIEHVLTRYKVDKNLGKDVTHIYEGKSVKDVFGYKIPGELYDMGEYGVKSEIIMTDENFKRYKEYVGDDRCNRRSAVTSITNRTAENFDPKLLEFVEAIPLQIATDYYIGDSSATAIWVDNRIWLYIGQINGRHQYVALYAICGYTIDTFRGWDAERIASHIYQNSRLKIESDAKHRGYPIDGMVITAYEEDIMRTLGREHDKNKFQVAFKFPAGIKKTRIEAVDFQVGPIAGSITPVAIVKPIVLNGNRITHVGLSNMEKLERLDLHIGDEVLIQYDIIPKIMLDNTCKKSNGEKIKPPTECPVCYHELENGRCVNYTCPSKLVGRILGFTKKMVIRGFGIETIRTLVSKGILRTISDLYNLGIVRKSIEGLPGFSKKSVDNLVTAPLKRTNVYPHELLGSIGIPDISLATMELVCRKFPITSLVDGGISVSELSSIKGIGDKKAIKIIEGVAHNRELLLAILPWFTFREYGEEAMKNVVFTKVRDQNFSDFLLTKDISTAENLSSKTIALIVPDGTAVDSLKVREAVNRGIDILSLTDAKNRWNYNKGECNG